VSRKAKPGSKGATRAKTGRVGGRVWRVADLDPALQEELRSAVAETERGEGLTDFDEAMEDVRGMTDDILAVRPHRPA
jgi:hypothetical protein